jgi:hypothetical protein
MLVLQEGAEEADHAIPAEKYTEGEIDGVEAVGQDEIEREVKP